ncbi:D-alanine--D-alanine ligase family protein [Paenibacillus bouchesdurhonensis]|uniref:hypothetical protein n=1 Tax=Paenibacillus bouchesdurhonensis TaxID=1870990 RepID=UPI0018FF66ED|nr:hypothetical protein [Paenibacillus bouchesdurhonensis]
MYTSQKKIIDHYIQQAISVKDKILLILVMNVKDITVNYNDYSSMSVMSEYYSYKQYEEIISALRSCNYDVKSYFDENDFISDFQSGILRDNYPRKLVVINSAQKGTGAGRKSLIPAFCDLHGITYTGSDAYTVSFARDKYHWFSFLQQGGFPTCKSYLFDPNHHWIMNQKPNNGQRVIAKLNGESSSIGLDKENIFYYTEDKDQFLLQLSQKFNQRIIVEQFISGEEVEVPVISSFQNTCSLFPASITVNGNSDLNDTILDYTIRGDHLFDYELYYQKNPQIAEDIMKMTEEVTKAMNIQGFGRIDYRINHFNEFFITDIATNPHITQSMTFWFAYRQMGYSYSDVLQTLIGTALIQNDVRINSYEYSL